MFQDFAYSARLEELRLWSQVWWTLAGLSLTLLLVFAMRMSARFSVRQAVERQSSSEKRGLRELAEADSAIASMEFLMVFFPFLIIVMTVWQMAFMFNARLHVGYSAYAAARSASVMIPMDLPNEKEGVLNAEGQSNATKWKRIRKAAIPGTIAISPGDMGSAAGVAVANAVKTGKGGGLGGLPNFGGVLPRLTLMSAHHPPGALQGTRPQRAVVKMLYADKMTEVLVNGKGPKDAQNLESADSVTVTVNYVYWLNVPFVGRMLEATFEGFNNAVTNPVTGRPFDTNPLIFNPYPSHSMTETITMNSWPRKRAIEPCNQ